MFFHIFADLRHGMVCVAVAAQIRTAVIPADITACDAETAAAVPEMSGAAERTAVRFSDHIQRIAAAFFDSVLLIGVVGAARLQRKGMPCRDQRNTPCKIMFELIVQGKEIRQAGTEREERLHKSERAAAYVVRDLLCKPVEGFKDPFGRVAVCKKYGVKTPHQAFAAHKAAEFLQRSDAVVGGGNIRLDIISVCRDRIMKKSAVMRGDFRQSAQNWFIVFGAEEHGVHFVRMQYISRNAVGEKGISRIDESFPKPFQEPVGIMVDNVCSDTCADDHLTTAPCGQILAEIIAYSDAFVKFLRGACFLHNIS